MQNLNQCFVAFLVIADRGGLKTEQCPIVGVVKALGLQEPWSLKGALGFRAPMTSVWLRMQASKRRVACSITWCCRHFLGVAGEEYLHLRRTEFRSGGQNWASADQGFLGWDFIVPDPDRGHGVAIRFGLRESTRAEDKIEALRV